MPAGEHGFTGLKVDAICANGSIIRGRNGELLKTFTVNPAFVEELIRSFPQICFDCCTPDGMFSSGSFEMHQEGFRRDNLFRRIVMRGMRARGGTHEEQFFDQSISPILSHDVCKINCRVTSDDLERELKAFLADHADTVVNAPFDPVMFEITDKDCNKGPRLLGSAAIMASRRMRSPCTAMAATTWLCCVGSVIHTQRLTVVPRPRRRRVRSSAAASSTPCPSTSSRRFAPSVVAL